MSQQVKALEDRVSRLEIDLKQLRQLFDAHKHAPEPAPAPEPAEPVKRGPGRPRKEPQP